MTGYRWVARPAAAALCVITVAAATAAPAATATTAVEAQVRGPGLAPHLLGLDLVSAGARVRIGGERVIGQEQPEAFQQWDLWANVRLPWLRQYNASGWGLETRLLGSAGVLKGKDDSALVLSLLPTVAFGSMDGRWSIDAGFGAALLSQHKFAQQDFGGYAQFALTAGISVPFYKRVGLGYRFLHYSDAALYGTDTIGADFHMLEVSWRY